MTFDKSHLAVLTILGIQVFGYVPPWPHSGIYCDDPSISYKYQGDTVSTAYLFLGILLPSIVVVSEFILTTMRDLDFLVMHHGLPFVVLTCFAR